MNHRHGIHLLQCKLGYAGSRNSVQHPSPFRSDNRHRTDVGGHTPGIGPACQQGWYDEAVGDLGIAPKQVLYFEAHRPDLGNLVGKEVDGGTEALPADSAMYSWRY